ncbi:MAG: ABC transporter permease [Clostridia bacterium]|nr:ABC transporter permease [Oscillospiraceae bacterium]MBQ6796913.1 ABC transporter permease [Clostridia bacterium]
MGQTFILVRRYAETIWNKKIKVAMLIGFPVLAAIVITLVINEDKMFSQFYETKTGLFMMAAAAIFVGLCNANTEVCKERNIVKREYMTNLNLSSYIASKLIVQGAICFVQTLILMLIYQSTFEFPEDGLIFSSGSTDIFMSLLLLMFSSTTMGLFLSSAVKTNDTANTITPYLLIFQIIFSGCLFDLEGAMDTVGSVMVSKWGMNALGTAADLNSLPGGLKTYDAYDYESGHLFAMWLILILFAAAFSIGSILILRRVSKDTRD